MKNLKMNQIFGWSTAIAALALSACGPQAYVPGTVQSNQSAAGTMNLAPKVDIVLGVSQDGTMKNVYPGLDAEIQRFTAKLEASGWDYRFVSIPLSEHFSVTESDYPLDGRVSVSHYDGLYFCYNGATLAHYPCGTQPWKAPYPNADPTNPSLQISNNFFSNIFRVPGEDPVHNDGRESGLKNLSTFLKRDDVQSQYLRPDAMLAMIVLSTGDDRSYGQWVYRWNGTNLETNQDWQADANPDPASAFTSSLSNVKNIQLRKLYTVVADPVGNNCRIAVTRNGITYRNAVNQISGAAINLCTTPISTALDQIAQNLEFQKLIFKKNFLVLKSEPSGGSIKVTKYSNGSSTELAQCSGAVANDCWTYKGYLINQDTVESPVKGSPATGYLIELFGTAKLNGSDTASVSYMNNGAVVSQ
jgi:hypothetical protein